MIKVIVVDIDGILLKNRGSFLNWCRPRQIKLLREMPGLKRTTISVGETLEKILGIRHEVNAPLIEQLNKIRRDLCCPRIMLFTDRSYVGLKNIWSEISELNLYPGDVIRIFGKKGGRQARKAIQKNLNTAAGILVTSHIKPRANSLFVIRRWSYCEDPPIKPEEVLIVDDDRFFLNVARAEGFRTITETHSNEITTFLIRGALAGF